MNSQGTDLRVSPTPASLAALAEQLRDGPLQYLLQLQAQMTELIERAADPSTNQVEEFAELVRLSVATMEHFNAFTSEFAAVLRELTNAHREPH